MTARTAAVVRTAHRLLADRLVGHRLLAHPLLPEGWVLAAWASLLLVVAAGLAGCAGLF